MRIILIAGVIISLSTLQSCKKKDTVVNEKTSVKLLTRIIVASQYGAVFKYYTYDDKHRLKTYKATPDLTTYTYNNDELAVIEGNSSVSGPSFKYEFTYNSGKPIQAVGKYYNKHLFYGYIYAGNSLSEIHVKEDGAVTVKLTYTIVNQNITKIIEEVQGAIYIKEYVYGTRKNMFFNARSSQINGVETLNGTEEFDKYSVNEVLESKVTSPDGTVVRTVNSYTYDEDGLPLTMSSAISLSTGGDLFVGKYTFEYELVE